MMSNQILNLCSITLGCCCFFFNFIVLIKQTTTFLQLCNISKIRNIVSPLMLKKNLFMNVFWMYFIIVGLSQKF